MRLITYLIIILISIVLFTNCGPKSTTTDIQDLNDTSRNWIPFTGNESVSFILDTLVWTFTGTGKEIYYENVRYMTDQSGFFTQQEDFYADFERQLLVFESSSTDFFFKYYLERNKGDTGEWDLFRLLMGDGDYYKNEMRIVSYESDSYDKGEKFSYKKSITLNGITFNDVYFLKQEQRPFEVYYTQSQGIVAFKISATEIWTIVQ